MNVTTVGSIPTPLPVPLPVQRPAAASASPDAGARNASEHGAAKPPPRTEPERPKLPPLKPVTTDEFRVMLGALPPSALTASLRDTGSRLDVYA